MLESREESFEGFGVLRSFKANSCRIFGRPWSSRNKDSLYIVHIVPMSPGLGEDKRGQARHVIANLGVIFYQAVSHSVQKSSNQFYIILTCISFFLFFLPIQLNLRGGHRMGFRYNKCWRGLIRIKGVQSG